MKKSAKEIKEIKDIKVKINANRLPKDGDKIIWNGKELIFTEVKSMPPRPPEPIPVERGKPYVLSIRNTTKEKLNAILFGWNKFNGNINYGSQLGVCIDSEIPKTDYAMLLAQSQNNPFEVSMFRFLSENKKQLKEVIYVHGHDANGRSYTDPIILKDHFGKGQYSKTQVECEYRMLVDGKSYLEIPMLPNTRLNVCIFPKIVYSLDKALAKIDALEKRFNDMISKFQTI